MIEGLLGTGWDDPKSAAIMALAGGLLQRNLSGGLLAANQAFGDAKNNAMRQQMAQMQMEQQRMALEKARRDEEMERQVLGAARDSFITPEKANSLSMGPMPDGSAPPMVRPGFNQQNFLQNLYGVNPMKALEWETKLAKDDAPVTVAPGGSLVTKRGQVLYTAPKESDLPSEVRQYEYARAQGYKGSFEQWDRERKQAGASKVDVRVNAEKSLLNDLAGGLGKSMVDAQGGARAALNTIATVNRLTDALDSGKVMAGPGTTFRQYGLQVGQMLGVGGQSAQETLLNTRQAIQSLAQLELDAAQQMKGQGQITEAERAIIRRAASGDIDGMTANELRLLGGVLDRSARTKIQSYNRQVQPLMQNPNAAPIAPFLQVDEPPSRQQPGKVRRFNPQTGRIE